MLSFMSRHKIISALVLIFVGVPLLLMLLLAGYVTYTMRGPHREYSVDYVLPAPNAWDAVGNLEVGVAVRDVSPLMEQKDTWVDVDSNNKFNPKIDTWEDRNGNGDFDLVWIGGFGIDRAAKGINDPVWARAMAFRNNGITIAVVSIDSVGITYDRYITIRKMIQEKNPDIDHVAFAATHTHEAPDTMGIWSYWFLWGSRFDEGYITMIQEKACEAVLEAVDNLTPADAVITTAYVPKENFTRDSRQPDVVDNQLPLAWFKKKGTEETIGILTSWGMHPEAMGGKNPYVSSDFVHYFRQAMEFGLQGPERFDGFGGKCVFFTGPIGGLMTQLGIEITDRHGNTYKEDSIEKAQAQGENLAVIAAKALRSEESKMMEDQRVAVSAQTFYAAMGWPFKAALYLGVVHPGVFNGKARSEINALRIGEIEIVTTPGEIYPEIVFGGVENPEGADFKIAPVEVPAFFDVMKGTLKMNFNLGNDEIGYIVPKSQWDQKPPYTYGRDSAPYGEIYTGNPEIAPDIHRFTLDMLSRLHNTLETAPQPGV
jgi:hypothetical protein